MWCFTKYFGKHFQCPTIKDEQLGFGKRKKDLSNQYIIPWFLFST